MASKADTGRRAEAGATARQEEVGLVYRYGSIGIEAVAAAARYAEPQRAGTPKAPRIDARFFETAV